MSSFSGEVTQVSNTRIFARATSENVQYLVYQMDYASDQDLALVLPLPTPAGSAVDSVRFYDLSSYPGFFDDLSGGFALARNAPAGGGHKAATPTGNFEISFAPTVGELSKMESQFRIPDEIWAQLPEYNDYGFVVCKLRAGAATTDPLAFSFPMRNPRLLYFPTLHIRGGTAEADAYFDHDLFSQGQAGWMRSYDVAASFMDMGRVGEILDGGQRVERFTVLGTHPNSDIVITLSD